MPCASPTPPASRAPACHRWRIQVAWALRTYRAARPPCRRLCPQTSRTRTMMPASSIIPPQGTQFRATRGVQRAGRPSGICARLQRRPAPAMQGASAVPPMRRMPHGETALRRCCQWVCHWTWRSRCQPRGASLAGAGAMAGGLAAPAGRAVDLSAHPVPSLSQISRALRGGRAWTRQWQRRVRGAARSRARSIWTSPTCRWGATLWRRPRRRERTRGRRRAARRPRSCQPCGGACWRSSSTATRPWRMGPPPPSRWWSKWATAKRPPKLLAGTPTTMCADWRLRRRSWSLWWTAIWLISRACVSCSRCTTCTGSQMPRTRRCGHWSPAPRCPPSRRRCPSHCLTLRTSGSSTRRGRWAVRGWGRPHCYWMSSSSGCLSWTPASKRVSHCCIGQALLALRCAMGV
mmetsp:Transcript_19267/g.58174  ORF Transcript_19267/g.58174 Transcript_19267/m.58174 type:complete len:405 (-) Transcript_19267:351-1565(-)